MQAHATERDAEILESSARESPKARRKFAGAAPACLEIKFNRFVSLLGSHLSHSEASLARSCSNAAPASRAAWPRRFVQLALFLKHCLPTTRAAKRSVFLAGLAQEASDWRIAALEAGPVALLSRFDIVAERVIEEPHSLGATEDAQVGQDAQTALDALRLLQPPGPKKQRSGPGGGPRKGTRSKNKQDVQATKLAEEQKLMGIVPCASDSEGVPSDLDFESASEGGAQDRGNLSDDAEAFPAPQASSSSSGVPPGVPASSSAAASASRPKRTLQKRAVAWGVFQLAPIYNRGQHTGWGAMCNLHSDAADRANVACKKAMTKGALSDNECQLRLKRWLVAGLDDSSWPKHGARSAHVSLGGVQLAHFAHGLSAQQLDARVCPSRGAA